MILAINLEEDEIEDFDLYKAIQYVWLNTDSVTQYDDVDAFKRNYKEHITNKMGVNWVGIVDIEHGHYNIINVTKKGEKT